MTRPDIRGQKIDLFLILIVLSMVLGAFLRLYYVNSQVIGDDEWHGITAAVSKSFNYVFTHFQDSDNCIPLTLYYKALLETTGLSEFGLHSLQILFGLLSLMVFPFLARSLFDKKISLIFSVLLSISPFLVFYSRYARPYIIIVFLSFVAIFSFYFWVIKNRAGYLVMYLTAAVLAVYFNLPSLGAVTAPLLYAVVYLAGRKINFFKSDKLVVQPLSHLIYAGILLSAGLAILFYFPATNSLGTIIRKVHGDFTDIDRYTITGFITLFSGSGSLSMAIMFVLFFIYGAYLSYRKNSFLFGCIFSAISLQLLLLAVVRPTGVKEPVVFARYSICCLPLWLLLISIGLEDAHRKLTNLIHKENSPLRVIPHIAAVAFVVAAFLSGPIPTVYARPNNFTNHNDFQNDYRYTWTRSDLHSLKNPIPQFYFYLKDLKGTRIIEAPYIISWIGNNYHIYQRLHRKEVMIGYTSRSYLAQSIPVMHANIRLHNFVNIENFEDIVKSNASFVVIHKDLLNEFLFIRSNFADLNRPANYVEYVRSQRDHYEKLFGLPAREEAEKATEFLKNKLGGPFYEDRLIVVFRVKQ